MYVDTIGYYIVRNKAAYEGSYLKEIKSVTKIWITLEIFVYYKDNYLSCYSLLFKQMKGITDLSVR